MLFLQLFCGLSSFAQNHPDSLFLPNLQVGLSAGTSIFFGDIKQNKFIPVSANNNEWRFAYGMNFNYNISPVFTMSLQGLYGELSGTKRDKNIWFENDYYELNVNTRINFNNLFGKNREDRLFNLYGTIGYGILNYNAIVKRMDEYFVLKRVGYGYGTGFKGRDRQSFFLVGAGINVRINNRFDILVESANKYAFTDLLDGADAGKYNDVYNYTSVGLVYRFAFLKTAGKGKHVRRLNESKLNVQPIESRNISPDLLVSEPSTAMIEFKKVEIKSKKEPARSLIDFRVQILAEYGKPLSIQQVSEKFNIPADQINENVVGHYYVYTVGSFPNFSLANKKRLELSTQHGIKEAFVVAFKDGVRILPVRK